MKVEAFMTENVHAVTTEMTVREVIDLLTSKHISGAPVVDTVKKVISVVSEGDLLRLAAGGMLDQQISQCLGKLRPANSLLTIRRNDLFADVYKLFLQRQVHRLIVVDSNGKLQGIVSRSNVLRLLSTPPVEASNSKTSTSKESKQSA